MIVTNILLSILVILIFAQSLLPILLSKPPQKPITFENDILFLNYMINLQIEDYKRYIIVPSKTAGRALMTDEDLTKYRENLTLEVYTQLSPHYKGVLYKYFTEESLLFYITNTLNTEITKLLLQHNLSFFKMSSKDNKDNLTINDTDLK